MATAQRQQGDELHILRPNNPFVPPGNYICYVNNLPPELLSHTFKLAMTEEYDYDDDEILLSSDYWDDFLVLLEEMEDTASEDGDSGEGNDNSPPRATRSPRRLPLWYPCPVAISHVCRRWRHVALSTPSLWTMIDITPHKRQTHELESAMLARSKNLPLYCYLDLVSLSEEYKDSFNPQSLFSAVVAHVHRWRFMAVAARRYHHMHAFLSALSDPSIPAAPRLKNLKLLFDDPYNEERDTPGYPGKWKDLILFGGSAPLLTTVRLSWVNVDWNQPWITSASNLKVLELRFVPEDHTPSWDQFSAMLRGAPVLEKLTLHGSGPCGDVAEWPNELNYESNAEANRLIPLLRLTDLILSYQPQRSTVALFQMLSLPALKRLDLQFPFGNFTHLVHTLTGPETSPTATGRPRSVLDGLESLTLSFPCHEVCADVMYDHLDQLTFLHIGLVSLPERFLDVLTRRRWLGKRRGWGVWLPRLKTLYVVGVGVHVLRRVVRKRREAGVPLKRVQVQKSTLIQDDPQAHVPDTSSDEEESDASDEEDSETD